MKKACITGITGQTGSYLAEVLLDQGYEVYGLVRRSSSFNTKRINHIYDSIKLTYGDLSDYGSISNWVRQIQPNEFYNCAAQSHVRVSFDIPDYTMDIGATGVIRCLEALCKFSPETKFVQCSTSVSGDTKVLIRKNGEVQLLPIEDLTDSDSEKTNYADLQCLTVDENYKVKWSDVAYVFSHESSNIYNLKGSGGLDITITGDHSVIVIDSDGNLSEKKVEELDRNEFLLSPTFSSDGINPVIDMTHRRNHEQYISRSNPQIDSICISPDIMRLIGFYLSEGSLYMGKRNSVTFTFHLNETDYCEDIKRIVFENFGIDNVYENERCDNNSRQLTISSKQLTYFLYENFGKLAKGKKIPGWVFNLPTDSFIEMMRGYMGDARITKNEVIYTSINKDLIEQLTYVSKMHGLDCRISKRYNKPHRLPQGTVTQGNWCYDLKFSGRNRDLLLGDVVDRSKFLQLNQDLIPGKTFRKLADKDGLKAIGCKKSISKDRALHFANSSDRLKSLCCGDIHIVRIKSIEKLDRTMRVYDLHVPETQRFIGGNYPILLHNSELFGSAPPPQNETTPFHPRSPYGCAKIAAYWATVNYRESGKLFATNSISYNHESSRRGETFVTRKITRAATRIKLGLQEKLVLGNLDAKRDWNHAKDVARAIHMMATAPKADDWVVASGEMHSVRDFLTLVFEKLDLDWEEFVDFDPRYLRPTEVDALCGDSTKIRTELGWKPEYTFDQLVDEMVESDLRLAHREKKLQE